jgi:hypothetical protein
MEKFDGRKSGTEESEQIRIRVVKQVLLWSLNYHLDHKKTEKRV